MTCVSSVGGSSSRPAPASAWRERLFLLPTYQYLSQVPSFINLPFHLTRFICQTKSELSSAQEPSLSLPKRSVQRLAS